MVILLLNISVNQSKEKKTQSIKSHTIMVGLFLTVKCLQFLVLVKVVPMEGADT